MHYLQPSLFFLLLMLGLATIAPAQTWQVPNPDLGVSKPEGMRIPTPSQFLEDQQVRTRAQNQAKMAEAARYNAQQAQRDQ